MIEKGPAGDVTGDSLLYSDIWQHYIFKLL